MEYFTVDSVKCCWCDNNNKRNNIYFEYNEHWIIIERKMAARDRVGAIKSGRTNRAAATYRICILSCFAQTPLAFTNNNINKIEPAHRSTAPL